MKTNIWWIRQDLRLRDNQALHAALQNNSENVQVIPLFIIEPNLWQGHWFSRQRAAFLAENLRALDADLRKRGSYLVVRFGDPEETLTHFISSQKAKRVFAERGYSPYTTRRDAHMIQAGIPLTLVGGDMVHPPDSLLKADGTPYKVYTPFMRLWRSLPAPSLFDILPIPEKIPTPADVRTTLLPEILYNAEQTGFPTGEDEALRRLSAFTDGPDAPIFKYAEQRDRPDLQGTSGLSPYLRFGMLSIRQAVVTAQAAIETAKDENSRKGPETWLNELIWREFYKYILYHYPHALKESFRQKYRGIPWVNDQVDFTDWKKGKTGYPIVDAAMRQLAKTGWMHNRARMLTASFLVKNLMVDWRLGETWFMQNLLDGAPAANNGGWQWTAGTGTDAAPYFRIFNPVTQSKKFDPSGDYIRRWLPELRDVPDKYIHTPWEMDKQTQEASDCLIGIHYPEPIIDLKFSRQRALDLYKQTTEKAMG